MNTTQVIVLLFIFIIVGLFNLVNDYRKVIIKRNFAIEYLHKFQKFRESHSADFSGETYYWLTKHVSQMQSQLGFFGVVDYQPPCSNYINRNYQVIVNTLPEMRNRNAHSSMINACEDALIRYIGHLDNVFESSINQLKNPFKWLQTGVQLTISLPFFILYWLGLISLYYVEKITDNFIFKLISGFITLASLIASIITIVLGWDRFVNLMQKLVYIL